MCRNSRSSRDIRRSVPLSSLDELLIRPSQKRRTPSQHMDMLRCMRKLHDQHNRPHQMQRFRSNHQPGKSSMPKILQHRPGQKARQMVDTSMVRPQQEGL